MLHPLQVLKMVRIFAMDLSGILCFPSGFYSADHNMWTYPYVTFIKFCQLPSVLEQLFRGPILRPKGSGFLQGSVWSRDVQSFGFVFWNYLNQIPNSNYIKNLAKWFWQKAIGYRSKTLHMSSLTLHPWALPPKAHPILALGEAPSPVLWKCYRAPLCRSQDVITFQWQFLNSRPIVWGAGRLVICCPITYNRISSA